MKIMAKLNFYRIILLIIRIVIIILIWIELLLGLIILGVLEQSRLQYLLTSKTIILIIAIIVRALLGIQKGWKEAIIRDKIDKIRLKNQQILKNKANKL